MKPKTWFISDTHFMHQNVALLRGYSSYEEQDLDILDKWNSIPQKVLHKLMYVGMHGKDLYN